MGISAMDRGESLLEEAVTYRSKTLIRAAEGRS